jgi:hypothetical protein
MTRRRAPRPEGAELIPHGELKAAIRLLWFRSKQRRSALQLARISGGLYLCAACGIAVAKPEVDHREPVGPTPGARGSAPDQSWDALIARMFCPADGLAVLCKPCHKNKTHGVDDDDGD